MAVNLSKSMLGWMAPLLFVGVVLIGQPANIVAQQPQWGSLRGRFVYQGTPPARRVLEVGGENLSLLAGHSQMRDESLIVDPYTHGVKNIVIYAKRVSRVHPMYGKRGRAPLHVKIQNNRFAPHVITMSVDQTLVVTNLDSNTHTASIQPPLEVGINTLLAPGEHSSYKFPRQQSSPVAVFSHLCHGAIAYVLPRNNPYLAVSDAQGNFEIANLPADEEIEWIVWHEKAHHLNAHQDLIPTTLAGNTTTDVGEIAISGSTFHTGPLQSALAVR